MTRAFTIWFQVVGTIIQFGNIASGFLPPKYQLLVVTLVGALQAAQGVIAHNYNPNGTPATMAYVAPAPSGNIPLKCLVFVLLLPALVLGGCASTTLGKAIQAADIQKQLVKEATIQAIVACDQGKLSAAAQAQCPSIAKWYGDWAKGQQTIADSLAAWKVVSSADNESKLQAALSTVKTLANDLLAFLGAFVDVGKIAAALSAT